MVYINYTFITCLPFPDLIENEKLKCDYSVLCSILFYNYSVLCSILFYNYSVEFTHAPVSFTITLYSLHLLHSLLPLLGRVYTCSILFYNYEYIKNDENLDYLLRNNNTI